MSKGYGIAHIVLLILIFCVDISCVDISPYLSPTNRVGKIFDPPKLANHS